MHVSEPRRKAPRNVIASSPTMSLMLSWMSITWKTTPTATTWTATIRTATTAKPRERALLMGPRESESSQHSGKRQSSCWTWLRWLSGIWTLQDAPYLYVPSAKSRAQRTPSCAVQIATVGYFAAPVTKWCIRVHFMTGKGCTAESGCSAMSMFKKMAAWRPKPKYCIATVFAVPGPTKWGWLWEKGC